MKDGSWFKRQELKVRNKISGLSKRRARERLTIDRSGLGFTKKVHEVDEATETGDYIVVHHEEQKFPAKRRPSGTRSDPE